MSTSQSRKRVYHNIKRRIELLSLVEKALMENQPLGDWDEGKRKEYSRLLAEMGITLVSETWLAENGYRLKHRQTPIAVAYFGKPVKKKRQLFVLECQAELASES